MRPIKLHLEGGECNALTEIPKTKYDSSSEKASRERESRNLKQTKENTKRRPNQCTCFGTRDQRSDRA